MVGSTVMTTALCADDCVVRASEVKSGKPTTTPPATTASRRHWSRAGRGAAGARLRAARQLDDFFVAGPLQQAALEFVTAPAWTRHRRTLRTALRARREALLAALARHLPEVTVPMVPRGGLHLWVRLA